jgi:two-component system sensor histidine kinase TctE
MASLRSRLLASLIPPLIVVGVAAAGGAYVFINNHLTAAFDQDLGDIARAIVPYLRASNGRIELEVNEQADAILRMDSADKVVYAVFDSHGALITGDPALQRPPNIAGSDVSFWDGERLGERIRVAAIRADIGGSRVTVIAAETTRKRDRASQDALFSSIAPVALLLFAVGVAVMFAVRFGLGPVERLREELQERSHMDLRPVDERHVMDELRPLVQELNEMLSRLDAAQHTQARFIANAAHQLRTPIAGLVTQLDLARSDASSSEHLEHARLGAARLARLARQILSLAASDPISNPGDRHETGDLEAIVKEHAGDWLRAATSRDVEIEFELEPAPIHGNPLLVGELATNLVDNATRYGAKTVKVATRRAGSNALLEVADDGPGIPIDERTRIFERFRRLDNQSTEGSGLGLAIVSEIAQRHRAGVELTDGPGGSGTCVRVAFPLAA